MNEKAKHEYTQRMKKTNEKSILTSIYKDAYNVCTMYIKQNSHTQVYLHPSTHTPTLKQTEKNLVGKDKTNKHM